MRVRMVLIFMVLIFTVLVSAMIYSAFSLLPSKTAAQTSRCCSLNIECNSSTQICCKTSRIICDPYKRGFCVERRNCINPD